MPAQAHPVTRKKIVHQLDSPFSTTSWPEISQDDQDTILELLCSLLSPIGQHRRTYIVSSNGKRAERRRKRAMRTELPPVKAPVPPKPELDAKIDVGFNSISKGLQTLSETGQNPSKALDAEMVPYSMIFVARGNQPSAFNCHFPQLVGVASQKLPPDSKIRLIGFSKPCSERLSSSLGIARVSSIAIRGDAPGAEALWSVVKKVIEPVDVSWLGGQSDGKYQPTRIQTLETTVGVKRKTPS